MDNDEAKQRQGVEPTYQRICGFAPLQITWERFIIDTVFRGGSKHSNADDSVASAVRHLVGRIRKHYRADVPIVLRMDGGFFDQDLFKLFKELGVGYICGARQSDEVAECVTAADASAGGTYRTSSRSGSTSSSATAARAGIVCGASSTCAPSTKASRGLLEFARPDTVLVTNLGRGERIDDLLREAGHADWLTAEGIIKLQHQRGADELVFRALKEFASETLPFRGFDANSAFYHTMLVSFFLYEAFKEDVAAPVVPVTSRPTRVRRTLVDFAGKIVRTGGYLILRVPRASLKQLKLEDLWRRSGDPPRFAWSR